MSTNGTIVYTRPNTGVDWYEVTPEFVTYVLANFINTGLRTREVAVESEDGLTQTLEYTFPSQDAKIAWTTDETVQSMLNARDNYNLDNDIDMVRTEDES
ncbi:uncharacterized protein METZ01_LOCUS67945 [marine metagenome]|uniref:Uncharacterized protein n=1 Tax=marine metagenome TaxID=408172 RepID=A0A381THV7_9ZZZZ